MAQGLKKPRPGAKHKRSLTNSEKIKVLEGARRLLGKNGENWTKGHWFGLRRGSNRSWGTEPEKADCWCLLGALEESAFRLGYSVKRRNQHRFGLMTSLQQLVYSKHWSSISGFNDRNEWIDVRALLDERLKQLRAEERLAKAK